MTSSRSTRLLAAVLALVTTAACSGPADPSSAAPTRMAGQAPPEQATESAQGAETTTTGTPTSTGPTGPTSTTETTSGPPTTVGEPLSDQTAPRSTLGLAFRDRWLWVADFYSGQLLAVDPDSGAIMRRLTSEDNVTDEVNNVAVSADGAIFWTGLNDGAVGVMKGNAATNLPGVTPGTFGLDLSPDGRTLYSGGSIAAPGSMWRIDVRSEPVMSVSAEKMNLRSMIRLAPQAHACSSPAL